MMLRGQASCLLKQSDRKAPAWERKWFIPAVNEQRRRDQPHSCLLFWRLLLPAKWFYLEGAAFRHAERWKLWYVKDNKPNGLRDLCSPGAEHALRKEIVAAIIRSNQSILTISNPLIWLLNVKVQIYFVFWVFYVHVHLAWAPESSNKTCANTNFSADFSLVQKAEQPYIALPKLSSFNLGRWSTASQQY